MPIIIDNRFYLFITVFRDCDGLEDAMLLKWNPITKTLANKLFFVDYRGDTIIENEDIDW